MDRWAGSGLVIISAAAFGMLAIFGRYAYAAGMDVTTLLFLRFTLAAVLMVVLLMMRREGLPRGRTLGLLIGMGAVGYVGQSFAYLSAIQYASAGLVALLLYLYPTMVAILAVVFLKNKLTGRKLLALSLATAGAALTVNPQGGEAKGIMLAILAAGIYAVYIIVGTGVMKQVSAVQSSTVIFAAAGAVYAGMAALHGPKWPTTGQGWLVVGGVVLLATVIPVVTFLTGLKLSGPTEAAMLSTLEPVVTVVLAAILFKERLSGLSLLGGGMILLAVVLVVEDGRFVRIRGKGMHDDWASRRR
jgi:drug/metabolite transporter (DMT)-like permease